jgi:sugar lactone lactonase YvrE
MGMTMRRVAAAALLGMLWLPACGLKSRGLVVVLDDSYQAAVVATNRSGFAAPDGLLWRRGQLYLADEGAGGVALMGADNRVAALCGAGTGALSPEDLTMGADGNIYFTDDDAGGLWRVDAGGKVALVAGKDQGLISTEGVALAPDGRIVVGDGERHTVFSVGQDGAVSVLLGPERGVKKPEGLAFDGQGNLYIADNEDDVLYLLDRQGDLRRVIERRENFSPESIVYAHGALYITDSRGSKLCRFTPEEGLKAVAVFGGKLKNVQGVAVSEDGEIYVSVQSDLKRKVGYIVRLSRGARE